MINARLIAYLPISGLAASLFIALCGTPVLVPALEDVGLFGPTAIVLTVLFIVVAFTLGIRWGKSLRTLGEAETLTMLSITCLIAACMCLAFSYLPSPVQLVFLVVILAISVFVPKSTGDTKSVERSPDYGQSEIQTALPLEKPEAPEEESMGARFLGMLGRNWVIFGGFLLCVTTQPGLWSEYLVISPGLNGMMPQGFLDSIFGLLLGAFIMLFAARLLKEHAIRILYIVAPLFCVAFLVVIWFFGDWIISVGLFSFLPVGFSLAVCGILHITRLSSEQSRGLPPLIVFGPFMSFTLVLFIIWFAFFPIIGWAVSSVIDLTLKVIFLVAVAAQTIVLTQRQPIIATQTANRLLTDICKDISTRYSLSVRESEILFYLIQGRSASYIAELHFVTTSTIKTHTQRIYKKIGVHSKQELLDLVHKH